MADAPQSGMTLGTKLFVAFLVLATAGLSILTVLLSRENKYLRAYTASLEEKVASAGLIPGDTLEPLVLEDADAQPLDLTFAPDAPPTLLLLTNPGCDACDQTIPVWEIALSGAGPFEPDELRVIGVRAGVLGDELRDASSELWQCYGAQPGHEGWLRRIPVSPAALLIDPNGRILHRWYGYMSETRAPEMRMAIADAIGR